jgi:hypothetical protein
MMSNDEVRTCQNMSLIDYIGAYLTLEMIYLINRYDNRTSGWGVEYSAKAQLKFCAHKTKTDSMIT